MYIPWLVGLDLGQMADPSALAIASRRIDTWGHVQRQTYQIRHLERFQLGTPYPEIVEQVRARLAALPKPHRWDELQASRRLPLDGPVLLRKPYELILDVTGVGRPVADMFRALDTWPIMVTMTHGFNMSMPKRDEVHLPKVQLISAFQVALQQQRVQVARGLPESATLIKEAVNFQYKMSEKTGDEQYGAWREGTHDDLLFAACLAVWWGERTAPPQQTKQVQTHAKGTGNVLVRR